MPHTEFPHHRFCTQMEEEERGPVDALNSIMWSGSCNLFFLYLFRSFWMTLSVFLVFICQWGFCDTWTLQVYMLFSAAGKAGFSTLPLSCVVLLGNYICLHAVAQWTWPCFQAMPWAKQYKKGTVKCICPGIGLACRTSHTAVMLLGTLFAFDTRWFAGKAGILWETLKSLIKWHFTVTYWGYAGCCKALYT